MGLSGCNRTVSQGTSVFTSIKDSWGEWHILRRAHQTLERTFTSLHMFQTTPILACTQKVPKSVSRAERAAEPALYESGRVLGRAFQFLVECKVFLLLHYQIIVKMNIYGVLTF
jgi:hypothetical protein